MHSEASAAKTSNALGVKPRILLSDEHPIVLEGLRQVLEQEGFEIVGAVRDGLALVKAAQALSPDLIVLEIAMPSMNGIEAARSIRTLNPTVPLLFLSMHAPESYFEEVRHAGATYFVSKGAAVSEIGALIRDILEGKNGAFRSLAAKASYAVPVNTERVDGGPKLTKRQLEVLQLVTEGKTAKEVAIVLKISSRTAEFHKTRIMEVLGLRTIAELTRYAIKYKLAG